MSASTATGDELLDVVTGFADGAVAGADTADVRVLMSGYWGTDVVLVSDHGALEPPGRV